MLSTSNNAHSFGYSIFNFIKRYLNRFLIFVASLIDNNNSDIWSKTDKLESYLSQEMNITTLSDHHHHLYHHHEMKENGFSRMTQ